MTEIDVPDWVVAWALAAYKASRGTYEGEVPVDADDMRAALVAALGAWVVPVGRLNDSSPTLYTLRQEKPE